MTMSALLRLVAAVALTAAAGLVVPTPAHAAGCPTTNGVTVVVDNGGIQSTCVTGGGGDTAASLFEVHHNLTRVQRQPGAVCKVDGAPASAQCVNMPPANAYWGLFWSDGSGGWIYSSEGVDSLNVPNGGSVAFAWQNGGGTDYPGVPPASPRDEGSGSGSGGGGSGSGSGSGSDGPASSDTGGSGGADGTTSTPGQSDSPSGSASPSSKSGKPGKPDKPGKAGESKKDEREKPSESSDPESPSESPTNASAPVADPPSAADQGGLPTWVAPVGIAVLFAAAGVVALVRRRSVG